MKPLTVLFICTANISRSPYAEIRCRELFGDQARVASAGVPGTQGQPMDPTMEAELPFEDEDALTHRSRRLTAELVESSDLLLTMEFAHHMRVLDQWPHAAGKVFGLRQFVDGLATVNPVGTTTQRLDEAAMAVEPNSMVWDIADPYRRGSRAARTCARELDGLVLAAGVGLGYQPVAEH